MKWLIPGLLFLTACAAEPVRNESEIKQAPSIMIIPDDRPLYDHMVYFEIFEREAERNGVIVHNRLKKIKVKFAKDLGTTDSDKRNIIGLCEYHDDGENIVSFKIKDWNEGNGDFRESLVFHELGHCVLYRDHCDAKISEEVPVSNMHPTLPYPHDWAYRRKHYIKETFIPSKKCTNEKVR